MSTARRVSLLLLVVLFAAACAARARPGPLPGPVELPALSAGPYRLRPGDELELRFFHTPEHDLLTTVRPDGSLSVPLLHEVVAAGRTLEDLRRELVTAYASELAEPELTLVVRTFAPSAVHVGGEVARPGLVSLATAPTVLEAVLAAGGWLPSASLAHVLVVRRAEPAGYELLAVDLGAVLGGRDGRGNVVLRASDVVYVPSSPIAEVNRWVDQYLRRNIPISFSYRLDAN